MWQCEEIVPELFHLNPFGSLCIERDVVCLSLCTPLTAVGRRIHDIRQVICHLTFVLCRRRWFRLVTSFLSNIDVTIEVFGIE